MSLIIEAIMIGLAEIVIGYFVIFCMKQANLKFDKHIQMILGFFIIGVIIHLFCEFTGINKWYCKNGNACLR
jgi:hypothetical protein